MKGKAMRYKSEKEQSFENLYETYCNDVYKVSLYYVKDEYAARDIAQKVFFELYLHYDNVDMSKVRAYLMRAARNTCFNWIRDTKREVKQGSLHAYSDNVELIGNPEDTHIAQECKQCEKEFFTHIMKCLREKDETWYNILNLVYCMGKSREEVAKELGITVQALYSRLHRAKEWLRKHYEDEYNKLY